MKLSIIIPVYNEARTIGLVIETIYNLELIQNIEKEIVIVNDCSTDESGIEIKRALESLGHPANIIPIKHDVNTGKGGAIHTGIKEVSGDYTIIQDADLELNPKEINLLLKKVIDEKVDIVYGSRFLNKTKGGTMLSNMANSFLTWLSNLIFRIKITDMETCYKLVPTSVFKSLNLVEKRFGFEPEITAKLAKNRELKWAEVPISYSPRNEEQGKKIGWKDGFRAIYCILKYGLSKKN